MEDSSEASDIYWDAESGSPTLVGVQEDQLEPSSSQSRLPSPTHTPELTQRSIAALDSSSEAPRGVLDDHRRLDLPNASEASTDKTELELEFELKPVHYSKASDNRDIAESTDLPTTAHSTIGPNSLSLCTVSQAGKLKGLATVDSENKVVSFIPCKVFTSGDIDKGLVNDITAAFKSQRDQDRIFGQISRSYPLPPWTMLGLRSAFLPKYSEKESEPPEDLMSTELKVFEAGFSNQVFSRSARLHPDQPPTIVRYKLHGTFDQFKKYISDETHKERQNEAWKTLTRNLVDLSYNNPLSPGFEKLAADFFGGREVREPEYYESSSCDVLDPSQPKTYVITYGQGSWSQILKADILHNEMALALFMQDILLNNNLQEAACQHRRFSTHGISVRDPTNLTSQAERDLIDSIFSKQLDHMKASKNEESSNTAHDHGFVGSPSGHRSIDSGSDPVANDTANSGLIPGAGYTATDLDSLFEDEPTNAKISDGKKKKNKKPKKKTGVKGRSYQKSGKDGSSNVKPSITSVSASEHEESHVQEEEPRISKVLPDEGGHFKETKSEPPPVLPDDDESGAWSVVQPRSSRKLRAPQQPPAIVFGPRRLPGNLQSLASGSQRGASGPSGSTLLMDYPSQQQVPITAFEQYRKPKKGAQNGKPGPLPKSFDNKMAANSDSKTSTMKSEKPPTVETSLPHEAVRPDHVEKITGHNLNEYLGLPSNASMSPALVSGGGSENWARVASDEVFSYEDVEEEHSHLLSSSLTVDATNSGQEILDDSFRTDEYIQSSSNADTDESHRGALEQTENKTGESASHGIAIPIPPAVVTRNLLVLRKSQSDPEIEATFQAYSILTDGSDSRSHINDPGDRPLVDGSHVGDNGDSDIQDRGQDHGISAGTENLATDTDPHFHAQGLADSPFTYGFIHYDPASSSGYSQGVVSANSHGASGEQHVGVQMESSSFTVVQGFVPLHSPLPPLPRNTMMGQSSGPKYCTYCAEPTNRGSQNTEIACPSCGPGMHSQYCSAACLLADAYHHGHSCVRSPVAPRFQVVNPPSGFYSPCNNPIPPIRDDGDTPERFRQRAFFMYCSSGPFPPLFNTWAKKASLPLPSVSMPMDWYKKTGEYAVFRSSTTGSPARGNPDADVIFTIKLMSEDPKKIGLLRFLNACFVAPRHELVEFLFRLIRNLILDPEYFEAHKYLDNTYTVFTEFQHQFFREFQFDESMERQDPNKFHFYNEYNALWTTLHRVEAENPVLLQDWA